MDNNCHIPDLDLSVTDESYVDETRVWRIKL